MNYGHFFLSVAAGISIGVAASTPNLYVAGGAIVTGTASILALSWWIDYSNRRAEDRTLSPSNHSPEGDA